MDNFEEKKKQLTPWLMKLDEDDSEIVLGVIICVAYKSGQTREHIHKVVDAIIDVNFPQ